MKTIFSLLIFISLIYNAKGQGCSDAGFCTAGSIKPSSQNDSIKNSLGVTFSYAKGERGTTILTPQFEPQFKVSDRSMVQIKIPFIFIKGSIGSINGIGDVMLSYNYKLDSVLGNLVMLTIGTRIATGTSSYKNDSIPMPMPYQVSLGTTDLILGARMELKKGFSLSIAYQQPLVNRNQNGFDSAAYKNLMKSKGLKADENYFISSYLERKGDLLLRIDKLFTFKKGVISIGLLPIYHLGNDKARINKATTITVENSKGLTLNANVGMYYKLNKKLELSAIAAAPLIVRQGRPDGLTRSFIFLPGLRYNL